MSELAKNILLRITPSGASLIIDGEEFPYHIAAEDIVIQGGSDGFSFARVSILAESITVGADLGEYDTGEFSGSDDPIRIEHTSAGSPDPNPWDVGWTFTFNEVEKPPSSVLAIEGVNEPNERKYLVRNDNNPNEWGWSENTVFDPLWGGDTWNRWEPSWGDQQFRVCKTVVK